MDYYWNRSVNTRVLLIPSKNKPFMVYESFSKIRDAGEPSFIAIIFLVQQVSRAIATKKLIARSSKKIGFY